eukprot:Awhi_evm1s3034
MKSADIVARKLKIFCFLGFPNILSHDNGTEFKNKLMSAFSKLVGMSQRCSASYNPQTQGANKRRHIEMKKLIKEELNGRLDWPTVLPLIQLKVNESVTERTRSALFSMFFGRSNNLLTNFDDRLPSDNSWGERIETLYDLVFPASLILKKWASGFRKLGPYVIAEKKFGNVLLKELNGDDAVGIGKRLVPAEHIFKIKHYDCSEVRANSQEYLRILDDGVDENHETIYL